MNHPITTAAKAEVDACSNVAEPSESEPKMPEQELAAAATDRAFAAHMSERSQSKESSKKTGAQSKESSKSATHVTISCRSRSPVRPIGETWNDLERSFTKTWPATYQAKWEGKAVTWKLQTITASTGAVTEKWRWDYNQ